MNQLPLEIENIIYDYAYQMEHSEKYERTLIIIKYLGECNVCKLCLYQNKAKLYLHILKRIKINPDIMYHTSLRHCYFKYMIFYREL